MLLTLPEQPSPLLSRALFYTGITRAKRKVEIWGLPARLSEAVSTKAERAAGLAERLGVTAEVPSPPPPPAQDQLSLF
ncbi:RecBCD enzyme subunit RecD [compost metagenome]